MAIPERSAVYQFLRHRHIVCPHTISMSLVEPCPIAAIDPSHAPLRSVAIEGLRYPGAEHRTTEHEALSGVRPGELEAVAQRGLEGLGSLRAIYRFALRVVAP